MGEPCFTSALRAGMFFKKAPEYTVQEVSQLLKSSQPPRLLDVRESPEWERAHLPGSRPLTQAAMAEVVDSWDPNMPIVTVCHHGIRSLKMARFLEGKGFTNVRSMKGGMEAWALEIDPTVPRY